MTRDEFLRLIQNVDQLILEDKPEEVQAICGEVAERMGSNRLFGAFFYENESQVLTGSDTGTILMIASVAAGREYRFKRKIVEKALLNVIISTWPDCFDAGFFKPHGYMPPEAAIEVVEGLRARIIKLLALLMSHGAMEGENRTVRLHQVSDEIAASNAFIENVNQISTVLQELNALHDVQRDVVRLMLSQTAEESWNGAFGAAEMTQLKETEQTRQQLLSKLHQLPTPTYPDFLNKHHAARAIIER